MPNDQRTYGSVVIELAAAESNARRLEDGGIELTFTLSAELFCAWLELVAIFAGTSPRRLH